MDAKLRADVQLDATFSVLLLLKPVGWRPGDWVGLETGKLGNSII
jgi:hypothetical protein